MALQNSVSRASRCVAYSKWASGTSVGRSLQSRLRLFCFPYAGGSASIFRGWSDALPPAIELCPIQLPGRQNRWTESPFTQLSSLVETLANTLRPMLNVPFAFFGHSMGAFISFELARQLRRENSKTPVHLFVSGARAPQLPDPDPPIHHLPDAAFVEALRRLSGIPDEVLQNAELMQVVLPTLRADVTMCETYVYSADEEPLSCPISAYGGEADGKVSYEDLAGWGAQTKNAFTVHIFPGDHFFLCSARESLLRVLSAALSAIVKRMNGEEGA